MKKVISTLILFVVLTLAVSMRAFAVWPPSTMLAEETEPAPSAQDTQKLSATSERAHEVVDKLEADEQRLQVVLRTIEEDKKKLEEQSNDGHPVR